MNVTHIYNLENLPADKKTHWQKLRTLILMPRRYQKKNFLISVESIL